MAHWSRYFNHGSAAVRQAQIKSRSLRDEIIGTHSFGVCDDGGCLCSYCCHTERKSIGFTTGADGWCLVGVCEPTGENNETSENVTLCDHCGDIVDPILFEE
jgi:hypothetical protein